MSAVNKYISSHPEQEGGTQDEGTNPWDRLPQQPSAHGPNGWLTRHFSMQHIQGTSGAAVGRERLSSEQSLGTGAAWWAPGALESPEVGRDIRIGWEKGQQRIVEEPMGVQYGFEGTMDRYEMPTYFPSLPPSATDDGNESGGSGARSDFSMRSEAEALRLSPLGVLPLGVSNAFESPANLGLGIAFPHLLPPVNTVPTGLGAAGSEDLVFALDEDSGALTPPPRHREPPSPKTPANIIHQSIQRPKLAAVSSLAPAGLYTRPGALARKGPLLNPLKPAKGAAYPPKYLAGAPPGTSVFAGMTGAAWALFLSSLQAKIDEALADGRWRQTPARKPALGTSCPRW